MKYLLPLVLVIALFGCEDNSLTYGEAKSRLMLGEFEVYSNLPSCDCDSLDQKEGEYFANDTLYTGTCHSYYKNQVDKVLETKQIFKGKIHGAYIIYSPAGDTIDFNLYKDGKLIQKNVSVAFECNCDSLKLEYPEDRDAPKTLYGIKYNGACVSYYPGDEEKIYMRKNYREGLLEGNVFVYSKDGNVISDQKYVKGKLQ